MKENHLIDILYKLTRLIKLGVLINFQLNMHN
jgi:hypothetical protein